MKAAQSGQADRAGDLARKILAQDYTDLRAHELLRQVCAKQKDEACVQHETFVTRGMLNSITGSGDGKSAKTAWLVISIEEEYFVLNAKGLRTSMQSLRLEDNKPYDVLSASGAGGAQDVWFDIGLFFGKEFQ
jgi:hypothetical protein